MWDWKKELEANFWFALCKSHGQIVNTKIAQILFKVPSDNSSDLTDSDKYEATGRTLPSIHSRINMKTATMKNLERAKSNLNSIYMPRKTTTADRGYDTDTTISRLSKVYTSHSGRHAFPGYSTTHDGYSRYDRTSEERSVYYQNRKYAMDRRDQEDLRFINQSNPNMQNFESSIKVPLF